jgi:hypothetical protein
MTTQITVRQSGWSSGYAPILRRAFAGPAAAEAYANTVQAVRDRAAVLWVALRDDGVCVGAMVFAVQRFPRRALYVMAAAAVPRTGFHWGRAVWPAIERYAREAGCYQIRAVADDAHNRRRLRMVGFGPDETALCREVAP